MNKYKLAMDKVKFDENFEEKILSGMGKRKNKGNSFKWITAGAGIAAAVLIMVFALPALQPDTQGVLPNNPAITSPYAKPTQSEQFELPILKVVVSSKYNSLSLDDVSTKDSYAIPKAGQYIIAREVNIALDDPENEGAYFFVNIHIVTNAFYNNQAKDFVYNGKSVAQWAVLVSLADGTYSYKTYCGDFGVQLSQEEWQSLLEEAKQSNAQVNFDAAQIAYDEKISGLVRETEEQAQEKEIKRLSALGYKVFLFDTWEFISDDVNTLIKDPRTVFAGLLTKEQLQSFDANSEYGYLIDWVRNGDGILDYGMNPQDDLLKQKLLTMNDTEKTEIELLATSLHQSEVMEVMKQKYPKEYEIYVAELARGDVPCPNPKEAQAAATLGEKIWVQLCGEKIDAFIQKLTSQYGVDKADILMSSTGEDISCQLLANKKSIQLLLEDPQILHIRISGGPGVDE